MRYDLTSETRAIGYKLLTATVTPRPIAWVTSISPEGVVNAAPYSFFNVMGDAPPVVALGIMGKPEGTFKDTARNIRATQNFVVNLVSRDLAEAMNLTCINAPPELSEIDLVKLDTLPGEHIATPRIARAPVSMECVLQQIVETGPAQQMFIGEVRAIHVSDTYLINTERGHVDTPALDLIARMHGAGSYACAPQMFEMERPVYADQNNQKP
ncbi:flavin reductase family protein [Sulfitobacter sp. KE34]|uniref:flavin reductase family protein n=1 Tax=unclassified Sulfitobacter TaxID=196795 RepID=UPI0023E0EC6E|nr:MULTISPECIES: flavin reductase family protein [unclassified Sulfitobacter]MDF3352028.1 flavin reductase family protein [Sulfitobacter sp. KE12]MDF3355717.1 flavin reductase family protein [Sulfitobacter sp. KE27]MDF3359274.1 flavin reductase family protein [Sulfitobacter sp. KE33]MDF3366662.1 flavin reductase family protein [Sulfitobacter sp. Ks34]MDF3370398.1 flavin reductase family protein [Sulfitobacter sp. Ks43]